MTSSLLLKGLAGVAALGGTVGGLAVYRKEIFGWGKASEEPESDDVSKFTQKELIDKVGLSCGFGEETELTDGTTKECSVKNNETIKVKVGDKEEEGVTFTANGSTKLKVSKSEEVVGGKEKYNKKLKFVVDSGDIDLTKKDGGGTLTHFQKLEQFETYEVFLRDGKFYLRRKTDAKEEKIKALGLPSSCSLPDTGTSECSLTTTEEIKKVNFEKQASEQVSLTTGTVGLKITKMNDSTDFTDGYRFTFTFPGDVTIGSKQLKAKIPYDYKIKKQANNSNTLSLEKAWSDDNAFTKKVGLECTGSSGTECSTMTSGGKLNVKQDTDKKHDITGFSGGKIKVEKDQEGYNQGLKFTITTADVTLSGGNKVGSSSDISKLEEYETYEIKEEGGKYYLSRKHESIVFLKKALGFEFCSKENFGQIFTCDITDVNKLKNIKFHKMDSFSNWPSEPIKIQLSIEKESSSGLKFTFNDDSSNSDDEKLKSSTGPWCIPDGAGGSLDLKKDSTNAEYKIKKGSGSDTTLCLEKKSGNSAGTCAK